MPTGQVFDFAEGVSSDIQYLRNDTVATYRGSDGKLRVSGQHSPRLDHDENGDFLGVLIENGGTNKCTNENTNPVDTTGWTLGGDAAGAISVVDDSAALATAGLDEICTSGDVYKLDNSGGAGSALFYVGGTVGNTNNHSAQVYARGTGTGSRTARMSFGNSGGLMDIAPAGDPYALYKIEGEAPDGTTRRLTFTVDAGDILYVTLFQLEENDYCTSIISGAGATRVVDLYRINSLDAKDYWNADAGFISLQYIPARTDFRQYLFAASDNSASDVYGLQLSNNGDGYLRGYNNALNGGEHLFATLDRPEATRKAGAFIAWDGNGEVTVASNGAVDTRTGLDEPVGITILNIGARNSNNLPLQGHIKQITIGQEYNLLDAGLFSLWGIEKRIATGGQSNMKNRFFVLTAEEPLGKEAYISTYEALNGGKVVYANGATGGAALLSTSVSPGTNYFLDPATGLYDGEAGIALFNSLKVIGNSATRFEWDQGEGDAGAVDTGTVTEAQYKSGLFKLFTDVRRFIGNVPVIINPLGRRGAAYSAEDGWQTIRGIQHELAAEYSWIKIVEKYDLELQGGGDTVHLSDQGYIDISERNARLAAREDGATVTGGVDSPSIVSASRSGTAVTVTLTHAQGADFTPTTGIEGFVFQDDGVAITINSAVRTNATTITLTLASEPTGVETLYYGLGTMEGINAANIVRDNTAETMPLLTTKIIL